MFTMVVLRICFRSVSTTDLVAFAFTPPQIYVEDRRIRLYASTVRLNDSRIHVFNVEQRATIFS